MAVRVPAQDLLGGADLRLAQGSAVGLAGVLLGGGGKADDGAAVDQGGLAAGEAGVLEGPAEGAQVLAVGHLQHPPALGLEAPAHVLGEGQAGAALDGDAVVVIEQHQLLQAQVPGQAGGLLAHALHDVAVPGEGEGAVVHHRVAGTVEPVASQRSAMAMPTALPMPCPRGPVVVSTPGVWPNSGWPGVREPHWRNCLRSSRDRS